MNPTTPRTVAVVDCGTTSIRAAFAEIGPTGLRILDTVTFPVDLRSSLLGNPIGRRSRDQLAEGLTEIHRVAQEFGTETIRVVGTAALANAINSDLVLEELSASCPLPIEIIDCAEEARLYTLALVDLWTRCDTCPPQEAVLLMDVGAGTTVVSVLRNGKLEQAVDEHFGTMRIHDQFRELRDVGDFVHTMERFTHGAVRMMLRRLYEVNFSSIVVTGGEIRALAQLIHPNDGADLVCLKQEEIESWYNSVCDLEPEARAAACSASKEVTAYLMLAVNLLRDLIEETGHTQIIVPRMRLLDGMLTDIQNSEVDGQEIVREQVVTSARAMAARYHMDLQYAENTASLATQIFDQTISLHRLGDRERNLLEFAAIVHDIGAFINVRNRHKHSSYLIRSSEQPGLNDHEIEIVAQVARYHRRSTPKTRHTEFAALCREDRVLVIRLAAILRLAYGMDVERTQRIRQIRCVVDGERLLIHADRRQVALERWSLAGKRQLFQDAFGLEVELIPRQEA